LGLTKAETKELALATYDGWINDKSATPPYPPKRLLTTAFGLSRASLYYHPTKPEADLRLRNQIVDLHEIDDTLGSRKLAILLGRSRISVSRVMLKYGIEPRRKKPAYRYPGKAEDVVANKLLNATNLDPEAEVLFSDILQFRLADRTWVYCCFVIRKITRQIIAFAYSWSMEASLITTNLGSLERLDLITNLANTEVIFHSDQGKQYGAHSTIDACLRLHFERSMSRAGTPTDNPIAERFVQSFKLAVTERYQYQNLKDFHNQAERWLNFYNNQRPHESLKQLSPNIYAQQKGLKTISHISLDFV
jgi:transposase InsO family protein